jgi:hypothetical protein
MWNKTGTEIIIEKPDEENCESSMSCRDSFREQQEPSKQKTIMEKMIEKNKEETVDVFNNVISATKKKNKKKKADSYDIFNIKKGLDNNSNKGYMSFDKGRLSNYMEGNTSTKEGMSERLKKSNVIFLF